MLWRTNVASGCSPTVTSVSSASRSPWSSPSPATSPRTPSTRSRSTSTRGPAVFDVERALDADGTGRAPGRRFESPGQHSCRRAARARRPDRLGAGRDDRDVPPAPLRDGADGAPGHPGELGRRPGSSPSGSRRRGRTACAASSRGRSASTTARCTSSCPTSAAAFGLKMNPLPEELAVVLAIGSSSAPVKWIQDRRENLMCDEHAARTWRP